MKKIVMFFLAIAMVVSMSISVFATAGGFTSSPSRNPAPELVSGKNESADCVSELVITAYGDRNDLSEEARREFEEAYSEIIGTQDLSTLNSEIKDIAESLGVEVSELAVSDLFCIEDTDCENHGNHGRFNIALKAETLNNFVCLLHYYNGEWLVVEDAEVTENGELSFSEKEFSPFAIVVSTGKTPAKSDNSGLITGIIIAVIVVVVLGVAVFLMIKFKVFNKIANTKVYNKIVNSKLFNKIFKSKKK